MLPVTSPIRSLYARVSEQSNLSRVVRFVGRHPMNPDKFGVADIVLQNVSFIWDPGLKR